MQNAYDYGRTARIGVGTPQANPTVEAEFGILLPRTCSMHVVRLTGAPNDPERRLRDYLTDLPAHLRRFDTFKPDIFGFACTGSSYLHGAAGESRIVEELSRHVGYPIVTAAQALRWALDRRQARRIVIAAPYPGWLLEAAGRYWTDAGFRVKQIAQIMTGSSDTRSIYELGSSAALPVLRGLDLDGVDAVLLSGTGMPSLAAIRAAPIAQPLLSSNLCLSACLMQRAGHGDLLDADLNVAGWRDRLADALIGSYHPGRAIK